MKQPNYRYMLSIKLSEAFETLGLPWIDYFRGLLRSLWLQSLRQTLPDDFSQEPQKVVVYESHRMSLIQSVVHIVPIGAAMYLIISNALSLNFPKYSADYSTGLQFAAKFLEILTQTSLASIFLGLLRKRLVSTKTVPLGIIFGPSQITNISFVWSLELWGLLTANWFQKRKRVLFLVVSYVSVILAALVGPSSAVLMIPRLFTRPALEIEVFFDNDTILYPDRINMEDLESRKFDEVALLDISLQWNIDGPGTGNWTVDDGTSGRVANWNTSENEVSTGVSSQSSVSTSVASIPGFIASFAMQVAQARAMWSSQTFQWSGTSLRQPLVRTGCSWQDYDTTDGLDDVYLLFRSSSGSIIHNITYSYFIQHSEINSNVDLFTAAAASPSDGYSALVAFSFDPINSSVPVQSFTMCVIEAVWTNAGCRYLTSQTTPQAKTGPPIMETENFNDISYDTNLWDSANTRILLGTSLPCNASKDVYECGPLLSGDLLSTIFALAISDFMPYDPDEYLNSISHHAEPYLSDHLGSPWSKGLEKLHLTTPSLPLMENANTANITLNFSVYGYGVDTVAVELSMVVLSLYCVIAATWVVYSIATGEAGHSWDSVSELFMLALNTTRPEHVINTSAGVATLSTFREPVEVRVNEERSLELIFAEDPGRDTTRLRRVLPNKKY